MPRQRRELYPSNAEVRLAKERQIAKRRKLEGRDLAIAEVTRLSFSPCSPFFLQQECERTAELQAEMALTRSWDPRRTFRGVHFDPDSAEP